MWEDVPEEMRILFLLVKAQTPRQLFFRVFARLKDCLLYQNLRRATLWSNLQ